MKSRNVGARYDLFLNVLLNRNKVYTRVHSRRGWVPYSVYLLSANNKYRFDIYIHGLINIISIRYICVHRKITSL